jgi:hypothetical protein
MTDHLSILLTRAAVAIQDERQGIPEVVNPDSGLAPLGNTDVLDRWDRGRSPDGLQLRTMD